MAELDLLLTDSARARLLHWTLEQGAVLVPDQHYHESDYEEIRSVAKLEQFSVVMQFFVLRSDWQVERLVMKPYTNRTHGPGFRIAQRFGGPSLSYALYAQRQEDERLLLGRGSVAHYPSYYSNTPGRQLKPADSLKSFFREVAAVMISGERDRFGSELKIVGRSATFRQLALVVPSFAFAQGSRNEKQH